MEAYFKAYFEAMKFHDTQFGFLNLLQKLFKGVLAIGNYAKSIDKAIESCINPEFLLAAALQALNLADEKAEDEENKEEVEEVFEFKSAHSFIKNYQLSSLLTECLSPLNVPKFSFLTLSQFFLLVMQKQALKQAVKEIKFNVKCQ